MPDFSLCLTAIASGEKISFGLFDTDEIAKKRKTIISVNSVFCDTRYSASLEGIQTSAVRKFRFFVNGFSVDTLFNAADGTFTINDTANADKPFADAFGFVRMSLKFEYLGERCNLETSHIPVMIAQDENANTLKLTADYVYRNYSIIAGEKIFGIEKKYFENRIAVLNKAINLFEESFSYFRANSRFSFANREYIDDFNKVNYVSQKTVAYIVQHPAELRRTSSQTGIKIGSSNYLPQRALSSNGIPCYDIYENRILLEFINAMAKDAGLNEKKLRDLFRRMPKSFTEISDNTGNYISSPGMIYSKIISKLGEYIDIFASLKIKTEALAAAYSEIWNIKTDAQLSQPEPTAVFMQIPQYGRLYNCICEWRSYSNEHSETESYMLSFLRVSTLYETYVLLKLLNYLTVSGYALTYADKKSYSHSGKYGFENNECKNYFVFKKDGITVTLYYQPVIGDGSENDGVGLFRSCSLPFPKYTENSERGFCYTPDFVAKIESEKSSNAKYIIIDAKYAEMSTVKKYYVAPLAFKYLFSMDAVNEWDEIGALIIINGKNIEGADEVYNIHDAEGPMNKSARQAAYIVTLCEHDLQNLSVEDSTPARSTEYAQFNNLRSVLGKYL